MDSTRIRKAFKYPSDDEGDVSHEEMDEEEQEHLLQDLSTSETSTNAIYMMVFTGLPLLVILPFLWCLTRSTTKAMVLLCLLSITSLIASAYIMYMIPLGTSLVSLSSLSQPASSARQRGFAVPRTSSLFTSDGTPINQYLPYLNIFISALLFLASWAYRSRVDGPEGFWLFLLLPGVIFGMVLVARRSMSDVQNSLSELRGMRYGYKGA